MIFIHFIIFLFFHLFGGMNQIYDLTLQLTRIGTSNFSMGALLGSSAGLYLLQYVLILITFSILFIYSHYWVCQQLCKKIAFIKPYLVHLLWSITAYASLILVHGTLLPDSYYTLVSTTLDSPVLVLLLFVIFTPLIFTLAFGLHGKKRIIAAVALVVLLIPTFSFPTSFEQKTEQPNIFLIGIDSLRPELITRYMPFLSAQLDDSVIFKNASTPFARTYPAWMTILTGRHPVNNGARFNLQPEYMLDADNDYLPEILKANGYQTSYASDERRFSNLGDTQGFEDVIGPRTGASDFILGNHADYPLMNLISLSYLNFILTPELTANRAAHHLYVPNAFSKLLNKHIANIKDDAPVFMATHFCLAHWPYTFVGHERDLNYPQNPDYPINLKAIDTQIQLLFTELERKGLLNNSRIVFLSDHGESWGQVKTGLFNQTSELEVIDYGHGMNILSPTSHQILMAFKGFNFTEPDTSRLTSLLDISPTLLAELNINIKSKIQLDGQSLLTKNMKPIEISFESGVIMPEANTANPDPALIAQKGSHRFEVRTDGKLRLKADEVESMIQRKQLGLRIENAGLFKGRFIDNQETYLLIDYSAKSFQTFNGMSNIDKSAHQLAQRFCSLYSPTNAALQADCDTL